MSLLSTRFHQQQQESSDASAFQRKSKDHLAACNARTQDLQATIREQHTGIERPRPPLQTFDTFSLLPVELRQMIWKCALRHPRLVRVLVCYKRIWGNNYYRWTVDRRDGSGVVYADGFPWLCELDATSAPVLFFVCQESREIALSTYDFVLLPCPPKNSVFTELSWSMSPKARQPDKHISHADITKKRAYFRPGQDTVYLSSGRNKIIDFLGSAREGEVETGSIKSLAIPLSCFESLAPKLLGHEAPFFGGLVELILITDKYNGNLDSNIEVMLAASGISVAPQNIEQQMESQQQKVPQMPVVKVMTESMLEAYVHGMEDASEKWRDLKTVQCHEQPNCTPKVSEAVWASAEDRCNSVILPYLKVK
ncbi:hypothetical protein VE03_10671, partial [Pseudogymnoascus sp. 23342-1-I1]